jgi:hypothetical protein
MTEDEFADAVEKLVKQLPDGTNVLVLIDSEKGGYVWRFTHCSACALRMLTGATGVFLSDIMGEDEQETVH